MQMQIERHRETRLETFEKSRNAFDFKTRRTDNGTPNDRSQPAHLRQRIVKTADQCRVGGDHERIAIANLSDLLDLCRVARTAVDAIANKVPERRSG